MFGREIRLNRNANDRPKDSPTGSILGLPRIGSPGRLRPCEDGGQAARCLAAPLVASSGQRHGPLRTVAEARPLAGRPAGTGQSVARGSTGSVRPCAHYAACRRPIDPDCGGGCDLPRPPYTALVHLFDYDPRTPLDIQEGTTSRSMRTAGS
jgi:hypothetical protein